MTVDSWVTSIIEMIRAGDITRAIDAIKDAPSADHLDKLETVLKSANWSGRLERIMNAIQARRTEL